MGGSYHPLCVLSQGVIPVRTFSGAAGYRYDVRRSIQGVHDRKCRTPAPQLPDDTVPGHAPHVSVGCVQSIQSRNDGNHDIRRQIIDILHPQQPFPLRAGPEISTGFVPKSYNEFSSIVHGCRACSSGKDPGPDTT